MAMASLRDGVRLVPCPVDHQVETFPYPTELVRTGEDPAEGRLDLCEALLVKRQLLTRHATHRMFVDPAWDMLVDLYIARARQVQISSTSLAYGANVPLSTATRLVQEMERHQLVTKVLDAQDRRRTFLQISDAGAALIDMILDGVEERRAWCAARRARRAAQWRAAIGFNTRGKARRVGLHSQ